MIFLDFLEDRTQMKNPFFLRWFVKTARAVWGVFVVLMISESLPKGMLPYVIISMQC